MRPDTKNLGIKAVFGIASTVCGAVLAVVGVLTNKNIYLISSAFLLLQIGFTVLILSLNSILLYIQFSIMLKRNLNVERNPVYFLLGLLLANVITSFLYGMYIGFYYLQN